MFFFPLFSDREVFPPPLTKMSNSEPVSDPAVPSTSTGQTPMGRSMAGYQPFGPPNVSLDPVHNNEHEVVDARKVLDRSHMKRTMLDETNLKTGVRRVIYQKIENTTSIKEGFDQHGRQTKKIQNITKRTVQLLTNEQDQKKRKRIMTQLKKKAQELCLEAEKEKDKPMEKVKGKVPYEMNFPESGEESSESNTASSRNVLRLSTSSANLNEDKEGKRDQI